jgi:tetratricopeptide (TPR) repeat protein
VRSFALVVLGVLTFASGCETYERRVPGSGKVSNVEEMPGDKRSVEQLKESCEKDPENPRNWAILGEYYEQRADYENAALAYEQMASLVDRISKQKGVPYTGGHYFLGKVYALLGRNDLAVPHLEAVTKLEPQDVKLACLNNHFSEAHYLLGAIYHLNHQWKPAKVQFEAYLRLQGSNQLAHARVEPYLAEIRKEMD